MRAVVLGAGLVGGPVALDLAGDFEVLAVDADPERLRRLERAGLAVEVAELSEPGVLGRLLRGAELAVCALPGRLGHRVLAGAVEAGVPAVVDIAFSPEDPFALDGLARERGVRAVVDAGVAPGLSNLLAAHGARLLGGRAEAVRIYVGGLPAVRSLPWQYRAVFSPRDVLEEYVRPARIVRAGRPEALPALSEPELLEFPGVGTLEAFLTDGLRSLLRRPLAPEMWEKTLRYPGSLERLRLLRDAGFLGTEPVELEAADGGRARVRPLDLAAELLLPAWRFGEDEEDLVALRVEVEGGGRLLRWELLDRRPAGGPHAMARCTGFTATAVARLLASGAGPGPGVWGLEDLAEPGPVRSVLGSLAARGVHVREREG